MTAMASNKFADVLMGMEKRLNLRIANLESKFQTTIKHRNSKNDWRDSCEIKMNNLEFSHLLTNLKILSEI